MYWQNNINAIWFRPSIDDAVDKLRYAYNNYETLNIGVDKQKCNIHDQYSWDAISNKFLELCK